MEGRFRFLGTGSSLGVPVVCCQCDVCLSNNAKNKRCRAANLLKIGEKTFLVDAGPDYRMQALSHKIDALDGFVLTHCHYDHMGGFEELKVYSHKGRKLPCLMLEETFAEMKKHYQHLMRPLPDGSDNSPFFSWQMVKPHTHFSVFEEVPFEILRFKQMQMPVMGFRLQELAYLSDIKEYDQELLHKLEGLGILIISAPRKASSLMHFSLEEAIAFARRVGAKKTYLTHIAHEMGHEAIEKELPPSFFLAYDGLEISFQAR